MEKLYSIQDWLDWLNISRTTFWRRIKSQKVPQPDKNVGTDDHPIWRWKQSTVDTYLANQPTTPST